MDRNTDIASDDDEIWFGETCVIGQQQVGWAQAAGNVFRVAAQMKSGLYPAKRTMKKEASCCRMKEANYSRRLIV